MRALEEVGQNPAGVRRMEFLRSTGAVRRSQRVGGVLNFYYRSAASGLDPSVGQNAVNGQLSTGSLHDAGGVEPPATMEVFAARITLLTGLLEAGVLRIVRDGPAP
jgi:hypothetical protein